MAQKIYAAVNKPAWDSTQWVKWTFRGGHEYLWDKFQQKVKVKWDDHEVILDLVNRQDTAKESGVVITGEDAKKLADKAYSLFCNDSFWFIAPFKLTDPGTQRSIVSMPDGRRGLKVSYTNGGTTPGDSYVWLVDDQGVPTSFKMWVSVLPIGGIESTYEKWISLPTGAKIASFHLIGGGLKSEITDIDGGMGNPGF